MKRWRETTAERTSIVNNIHLILNAFRELEQFCKASSSALPTVYMLRVQAAKGRMISAEAEKAKASGGAGAGIGFDMA